MPRGETLAPPSAELEAAIDVLDGYGLSGAEIETLSQRVHSTFRVEAAAGGGSYVLRLYGSGTYDAAEIRSEIAWLAALRRDEGLLVPEPVVARDGSRMQRLSPRGGATARYATLSRWMPGRVPETVPDTAAYRRFGEFMARLHRHGSRFQPPDGFERRRYDCRFLLGPPGRVMPASVGSGLLSATERRTLDAAAGLLRPAIEAVGEGPDVFGLIHGDLQPTNQLLHEGEVGALDFVDCGWGYFLYDIAGALLPVWEGRQAAAYRESFLRGYRRIRPLSRAHAELLGTFAVARGLAVLRWNLENWDDPAVRETGQAIVPHLKGQIRQFLERQAPASPPGGPPSTSFTEASSAGLPSTRELLTRLKERGIRLWEEGGRLRFKAPKGALTPELRTQLAARKAEILERLHTAAVPAGPPIVPVPREETQPTSFAQQRMWILDQIDPGSPIYHIAQAVRLTGDLRAGVLRRSLGEIVRRHEVLRTTFIFVEEEPRQVIAPPQALRLPLVDLRALGGPGRQGAARRLAREEARRSFDLARGPLSRFTLVRLAGDEHWLLLTLHHIVSDGWSNGVLVRELAALYNSGVTGVASALPELRVQYADFACWQRQRLRGEELDAQLAYWKDQLAGATGLLVLPTDRPRPPVLTHRGAEAPLLFQAALARELETFSRRRGVTLFMTLLTGFAALLHRITNEPDIVVGSPIANRNRPETEGLIGMFANTLALRTPIVGPEPFGEVLERIRTVTLGAYAHQDLPFDVLVDALEPERNPSYTPIFQVMLVLQNTPRPEIHLPGLRLSFVETPRTAAELDLSLTLRPRREGLAGTLTYATDLFDGTSVRRLLRHFERLLTAAVANPERRIGELSLLDPAERQQVLVEWDRQAATAAAEASIPRLFEARAARAPDAVALEAGSAALSYAELGARARGLARRLRSLGAGPEARVGLHVERSFDMVTAMLGILEAGAAYVPLEPTQPPGRLKWMGADADLSAAVTREPELWEKTGLPVIVPEPGGTVAPAPLPAKSRIDSESPAYVIYTSGSTGRPKGVVVRHGSLAGYVVDAGRRFALTPGDRVLQFAALSFDTSAEEIYPCLCRGATLVLRDEAMVESPDRFLEEVGRLAVTVLDLPTAYWHELTAALGAGKARCPPPLRLVILGGEAARRQAVETWGRTAGPGVRLLNTYGPTEATIVATRTWLKRDTGPEVPIGRPVENARGRVLDRRLRPLGAGVPGELCLGGAGLARGYLGRPGLTARSFVPDPWSRQPGARLYRTGDLAAWLADGSLAFRGRVDHQVKVRGFRVELGEVEAQLARHPAVREAAVLAQEERTSGHTELVAFLVAEPEQQPTVEALRRFLSRALPLYMVPARFETLEELPRTPGRKVDRRALARLRGRRLALEVAFTAPRTPLEEELAGIWRELLGSERIGVDDNFFDLGGNSLTATQLISRVRTACRAELSLATFFEGPTVTDLAASIEVSHRIVAQAARAPSAACEEREEEEL